MSGASSGSIICTGRQFWMLYLCLRNSLLALQFPASSSCAQGIFSSRAKKLAVGCEVLVFVIALAYVT